MPAETIYVEFRLDTETSGLHCEGDDKMAELWRALSERPDIDVYRSGETRRIQFPDFSSYIKQRAFDTGVPVCIVLATQRREGETLADVTERLTCIGEYLEKSERPIKFPYRPVLFIEEFGMQ
ncbi:MAG: hypothetical protein ABIH90_00325 [Candidatus Aenigmatarchaeota archaeon]